MTSRVGSASDTDTCKYKCPRGNLDTTFFPSRLLPELPCDFSATFSMFSPLRRSSPGPGIRHHTWAVRATSPPPSHPPTADNTTLATSRPPLKRQATAPAPSSSTVLTKKKRESVFDSEDDQATWSDDIHSAFLEGL